MLDFQGEEERRMSDDREARIRERAYHIWIEQGRPHGRDDEHWRQAEHDVDQEQQLGYEMLQLDEAETVAKPDADAVAPDNRLSQEPLMRTEEPGPMHAEKEPAHSAGASEGEESPPVAKARPRTKRATAEKKPEAAPAPRARKSKVKSGTMETL
jgi:hypothetical protein